MSQSTDTTANPRCGSCVQMRKEDGYCGRAGRYVNYFHAACNGYVDRIEAAEKEAFASMPEPEEPEVRVKEDAKMRRMALLHPDPKPTTRTCKSCGRELPLDKFTRSPKSRDGYTHTCLECFSRAMREKKLALWATKPHKEKPVKEDLPEGQKRCRRCGRILPTTDFGRHATTFDHLHPVCNECRKKDGRAAYEKRCAEKGIAPKPKDGEPKYKPITVRDLSDEDLVAELRYRGWTVTCTKEL